MGIPSTIGPWDYLVHKGPKPESVVSFKVLSGVSAA